MVPVGILLNQELRNEPSQTAGFRVKKIPNPGSGSASQNLSIFNQKIVSKLSAVCSGMLILDPDLDFLPIPDPGVKKAPDPGSQIWIRNTESLVGFQVLVQIMKVLPSSQYLAKARTWTFSIQDHDRLVQDVQPMKQVCSYSLTRTLSVYFTLVYYRYITQLFLVYYRYITQFFQFFFIFLNFWSLSQEIELVPLPRWIMETFR